MRANVSGRSTSVCSFYRDKAMQMDGVRNTDPPPVGTFYESGSSNSSADISSSSSFKKDVQNFLVYDLNFKNRQ